MLPWKRCRDSEGQRDQGDVALALPTPIVDFTKWKNSQIDLPQLLTRRFVVPRVDLTNWGTLAGESDQEVVDLGLAGPLVDLTKWRLIT